MNEIKFKVLMHCGLYIDSNLLESGIYATSKPTLYSKDETIESLIEKGKQMKDFAGLDFISQKYFDNLSLCVLTPVILYEVRQP